MNDLIKYIKIGVFYFDGRDRTYCTMESQSLLAQEEAADLAFTGR